MSNEINKNYECSIENFICKDADYSGYSICREERQYAVFLYDILRKYKSPDQRNNDDEKIRVSNKMKEDEKSHIVQFVREPDEKNVKDWEIQISKLIKLSEEIFE